MTAAAMGKRIAVSGTAERSNMDVAASGRVESRATSVVDFVALAMTFHNPVTAVPAEERARAHAEFAEIDEISGRGVGRSVLNRLPW